MKLYTSNFYFHKSKKMNNDDYIQRYMSSHFFDLFIHYKDYLILSNSTVRNVFSHFVEIELEIPEELIFVSNFVPHFLFIENSNMELEYFTKLADFSAEVGQKYSSSIFKDKQNFYIHKDHLQRHFLTNIQFPVDVIN